VDARKVFCNDDGFTRRVAMTSALKLFRNLVIFGVITMQNAQAADNGFLDNETLSRSFSGARAIYNLVWSPDQSKIALRGRGSVYLWDLVSDEEVWNAKGAAITLDGIAISPDNQHVIFPASGTAPSDYPDATAQDAALTLLPTTSPPVPRYVKNPDFAGGVNEITALASTSDGSLLAGVSGIFSGWVTLYDPKTWKAIKHIGQIKTSRGIIVNPTMIAVDSNRKNIVGAYVDGEVQVWNYENNKKVAQFSTSSSQLRAIALNPTNGEIITGAQEEVSFRFSSSIFLTEAVTRTAPS
jgi:WD40 repeat protein